ncbi:hypothetical protein ACH4PU_12540 [Streptomyces sp. NPDC021100]|uniref:hypothetical protein n=1 Tax=Streptomyces sp. NPDC021100 TaxID=3365114 RepID=UPI003793CD22
MVSAEQVREPALALSEAKVHACVTAASETSGILGRGRSEFLTVRLAGAGGHEMAGPLCQAWAGQAPDVLAEWHVPER